MFTLASTNYSDGEKYGYIVLGERFIIQEILNLDRRQILAFLSRNKALSQLEILRKDVVLTEITKDFIIAVCDYNKTDNDFILIPSPLKTFSVPCVKFDQPMIPSKNGNFVDLYVLISPEKLEVHIEVEQHDLKQHIETKYIGQPIEYSRIDELWNCTTFPGIQIGKYYFVLGSRTYQEWQAI